MPGNILLSNVRSERCCTITEMYRPLLAKTLKLSEPENCQSSKKRSEPQRFARAASWISGSIHNIIFYQY